jgi:hypothetical protein
VSEKIKYLVATEPSKVELEPKSAGIPEAQPCVEAARPLFGELSLQRPKKNLTLSNS